jgi:hypothetical protein
VVWLEWGSLGYTLKHVLVESRNVNLWACERAARVGNPIYCHLLCLDFAKASWWDFVCHYVLFFLTNMQLEIVGRGFEYRLKAQYHSMTSLPWYLVTMHWAHSLIFFTRTRKVCKNSRMGLGWSLQIALIDTSKCMDQEKKIVNSFRVKSIHEQAMNSQDSLWSWKEFSPL